MIRESKIENTRASIKDAEMGLQLNLGKMEMSSSTDKQTRASYSHD